MIQFNAWNIFAGLLVAILFGLLISSYKKCPECGGRATIYLCESCETRIGVRWERDYLGCRECDRVFTRVIEDPGKDTYWSESYKFPNYQSFNKYWKKPVN